MGDMDRNGLMLFFQCHLSESDALARKDALRSYISHALPPKTPGPEQHLSTLQGTQLETTERVRKTALSQNNIYVVKVETHQKSDRTAKVGNHSMSASGQELLLIQASSLISRINQSEATSVYYKGRAQKPLASFTSWRMTESLRKIFHFTRRGRPWGLHQFYGAVSIQFKHHETCRGHCFRISEDRVEKTQQMLPNFNPRYLPSFDPFVYLEPADVFHDYLEQEASKEKGAFIQAVWTVIGKPKLYNLVNRALTELGSQTLPPWIKLAQMLLDGCYGQKWPDSVFQVPDSCPFCLTPIH
ncbi:hypothetical protein TNCV_2056751 [Trichonephila clavipes]|nr:hypothetical protein TNCV_2056751 [Trichonephila clavipes]